VAYIVKRLFEIVKPHKAYFGLKDYQQLCVIKKMAKDFDLPVDIVPCETVRETDGLAMSSRNRRLSKAHRAKAPLVYENLLWLKNNYHKKNISELKNTFEYNLNSVGDMRVEYLEISDAETLVPAKTLLPDKKYMACTAVFLGDVRLIDNILLY